MIRNSTKKTILAKQTVICESTLAKAKGLMFSRPIIDKGLVFILGDETRMALHMFFVFFPIDILFLDKHSKVVDLKKNVKPFTPSIIPGTPTKYVVELPAGSIDKTKTEVGDKILFR